MELLAQLNSLGIDVNCKYTYINNGGCAVYAAIVGKALQDMGVNVKVLVAGSWWGNNGHVDKARENVKHIGKKEEWRKNNISFGHVGLEFFWKRKKYHYDSNGCHKPAKKLDGATIFPGRMTVEECIAIAKEARGWNTSFDRKHIPALRRMVAKHFDIMKAEM